MNSKTLIRKALSLCLMVAIYATYSMVTLASTERIAGELLISGKNSSVKVNGETAQSGRSVFSASTITTPENASAIINLGKIGKIELAPNTTLNLSFTEKGINGDLLNGKVTVLGANEIVNIKTTEGKTVKLNAGESVTAGQAKKDDDDDDGKIGGAAWWVWAAIFGGAVAGVVIAATSDNNRIALGGGTTVVSPSR
jgi:hypothetical protein